MAGGGGKNCGGCNGSFNNKLLDEILGGSKYTWTPTPKDKFLDSIVTTGDIKLTLYNNDGEAVAEKLTSPDTNEDQHKIDFGTATQPWGTVTLIRVTLPVGLTFDIPLIFARTVNANDSFRLIINRDELVEASKQAELAAPSPRSYSMPDIETHVHHISENGWKFYQDLELPPQPLRCEITHNPCGTDTWMKGHPCKCANCQAWLAYQPANLGLMGLDESGSMNTGIQPKRGNLAKKILSILDQPEIEDYTQSKAHSGAGTELKALPEIDLSKDLTVESLLASFVGIGYDPDYTRPFKWRPHDKAEISIETLEDIKAFRGDELNVHDIISIIEYADLTESQRLERRQFVKDMIFERVMKDIHERQSGSTYDASCIKVLEGLEPVEKKQSDWPMFDLCPDRTPKAARPSVHAIRAVTREDGSSNRELAINPE